MKMEHRSFEWRLACLVGIFAAAVAMTTGCSRIRYAKEGDPLWPLMGAKFQLVTDCYVVKYVNPRDGLDEPMLTCNIEKPGIGSPGLPSDVSDEFVGRVFEGKRIVGMVPRGTTVEITGVKWLVSFEDEIPILEVERLGDEGEKMADAKYDVISLLNMKHPEMGFDQAIARRVP